MPIVDAGRPGLRIGRWIPPYAAATGNVPLTRPTVPVPTEVPLPMESAGIHRAAGLSSRSVALTVGLTAILALSAVVAVALPKKGDRIPIGSSMATIPPLVFPPPSPPVSVLPAQPPATTTAAAEPAAGRTRWTGDGRSPAPRPSSRPAIPADPGWTVGRIISLEPERSPGYRVRHEDFRARIDRVGTTSRQLDQADATFTVRAGLADDKCVSMESVNYPGRYLRHQNFVVFLHKREGSALFAADATFCPVAVEPNAARVLRSFNYPNRYVVVHKSELFLDITAAAAATPFLVRAGL